jgi:hypothetical protein
MDNEIKIIEKYLAFLKLQYQEAKNRGLTMIMYDMDSRMIASEEILRKIKKFCSKSKTN